jgi:hypothetical protein
MRIFWVILYNPLTTTANDGMVNEERCVRSIHQKTICLPLPAIILSNQGVLFMRETVNGEQKDIVGIGKIMLDTNALSWNIPQLHFLVDQIGDHFEATCLEFGNVASGTIQEEAAEHLVAQLISHIQTVMNEGSGYTEFKDLALNNFMSEYWAAYRHIEFSLAEKKQDLSHELEGRITRAIQTMFDEKVKALIAVKAKEAAEEALREYERMIAFKVVAVTYIPLDRAA